MLALLDRLDIVINEVAEPSAYSVSPTAFVLDISSRTIEAPLGWNYGNVEGLDISVEALLHEAMHILTQSPYASIDEIPEPWILFQVELAYAKALGRDVLIAVEAWQADVIEANHPESPKFIAYWRQGYVIARKVGLLDANNEPTYKWPNWSVLSAEEQDSWQRIDPELE